MAGEKESESVAEVHDEQQGGGEETIAAAEEKQGKRKPQEPSGGERKKRWRRSIHEMLQLAQEKIDRHGDDAEERERRMVVVRHLRRQEEKLDEQDYDAWAAAHPPKKMPEARVAYYRSVLEEPEPRLLDESLLGSLIPGGADEIRKLNERIREASRSSKEMAAMMMEEYEAKDIICVLLFCFEKMRRKRPSHVVDISSSDGSDDSDFERPEKYRIQHRKKFGHHQFSEHCTESDDLASSDDDSFDPVLYNNYLKKRKKLKKLERELNRSLRQKAKRPKPSKSSSDAFTRFSVTTMSNLISNLTPTYKKVIGDNGFGSLLKFDKCYVPKKFVKWLATLVDAKSSDIIYNGKVIPLNKEGVHCVLELPLGGKPFPSDPSVGKAIILSKYQKHSIPPVTFFEEKLFTDHSMADENVLTCFLMVVMQSFLCCNSSLVPSYKYFGIFENVLKAKEFDWSGYVLDWSLDCFKSYNQECLQTGTDHHTLGGCWYFLTVVYLDHVDFGSRQPSDSIPRISIWKGSMIKNYSDQDMFSNGTFGLRPLLHHSETCYAKGSQIFRRSSTSLVECAEYLEKLDIASGCKLPQTLKVSIYELIENHSINSSISVNMNLASISSLPGDMKVMFTKLMSHYCKVDKSTQDLVLTLLKLVSDAACDDEEKSDDGDIQVQQSDSDKCNIASSKMPPVIVKPELPIDNLKPADDNQSAPQDGSVNVPEILRKLSKDVTDHQEHATPYKFVVPPNGYPKSFVENAISQRQQSLKIGGNTSIVSKVVPAKNPSVDNTNAFQHSAYKANEESLSYAAGCSQRDAIHIDNLNDSAPAAPSKRRVLRQFCSQLATADSDDQTPPLTQHTPMIMHSIDDSEDNSCEDAPNMSNSMRVFSTRFSGGKKQPSQHMKAKDSPEVVIRGERTLSDSVRAMSKRSDADYDAKYHQNSSIKTPIHSAAVKESSQATGREVVSSEFKCRDSSMGGKEPHYGPRRVVFPSSKLREDFVGIKKKYHVTSSEIHNYKAICSLASSGHQKEFAVDMSGVRCTYWSFGESLKPGGVVMPYVVTAYCYYLFSKSGGHPDMSKKYYYFPNIGENLLCDRSVAKLDILQRAFKLSKKARPLQRSDIIPNFQFHWYEYVGVDMPFEEYTELYPDVPYLDPENGTQSCTSFGSVIIIYPSCKYYTMVIFDDGIYVLLFLVLWHSPRTLLSQLFDSSDVPNIRIKIANTLLFLHNNVGNKSLVTEFKHQQDR
ncbi:hypothetical protein EJB05_47185, partial [Eragrostis curvula]